MALVASLEIPDHPLVEALQLAFALLIDAGEIDLSMLTDAEETDVQADDWTLHLEGWPITTAWIAIDPDPVSPREQLAALEATFDHREREALQEADRRLEGALLTCFRESGDDLSALLADLLERRGTAQDEGEVPAG